MNNRDRVAAFVAAIQPLVRIADAYDANELDEARPEWVQNGLQQEWQLDSTILYQGRGGRTMLTLGECFAAREALRDLQQIIPGEEPEEPPPAPGPRRRALQIT